MDKTTASVKVALVSATGDRRDEDIRNIGKLCAQMFDEIIIKHDEDLRGRTKEEITALLLEGIYSEAKPKIQIISKEKDAIQYALDTAVDNSFITILADKIYEVIDYVTEAQEKHNVDEISIDKLVNHANGIYK